MSKHTDFILSPISEVLQDFVSANAGIGNGIETYPLSEYMLQSVFLKMTGAQEQKMKCICWELATDDYEYRYKRYTRKPLGECSTYEEKKTIYKDLIDIIKKLQPSFDINLEFDRNAIARDTIGVIKNVIGRSNLATWTEQAYNEFINDRTILPHTQFLTNNNLFENILQNRYTLLYNHRNRCAHNTFSYQENLPTLKTLIQTDHQYDNYFVRFALLILIDKIFIQLYKRYKESLAQSTLF